MRYWDAVKNRFFAVTGSDGAINTKLTGSSLEQRGTASNKPSATSVEIGTTYWSVDDDPQGDAIEISDGTQWVVLQ